MTALADVPLRPGWIDGRWHGVLRDPSLPHQIVIRCHSQGSRMFVSCNCLRHGQGRRARWQQIGEAAMLLPAHEAIGRWKAWHAARGITVR